jgi:hypothetical protein
MQTRQIVESLRKGNMNEKTITHFLCVLNEKLEAQEKAILEQQRALNTLCDIVNAQLRVQTGVKSWVDGIAKKLGLDEKALGGVSSESMDQRVYLPGEDFTS